jgi:hypothetical protein
VRPPPDCHVGVLIRVRDDIPRSWRLEKFDEMGMSELAIHVLGWLEGASASGAIVTAMAARQVTCGSCRARTHIPDKDWDTQRDAIDEWWDEHMRSSHPDEDRTEIVHQVEPNPLFEPDPVNPFWR